MEKSGHWATSVHNFTKHFQSKNLPKRRKFAHSGHPVAIVQITLIQRFLGFVQSSQIGRKFAQSVIVYFG
jgi:hypothetical protein